MTIVSGSKTVAANGTEEALFSSETNVHKIIIQALAGNTNPVVVGGNPVTVATGYRLDANESITIDGGAIDGNSATFDASSIFIDVTTNGEGVSYTYFIYDI